jgi:hypothetical protein
VPELGGPGTDREGAGAAGLGGGDDLGRHATFDAQPASVQVVQTQGIELAAAGAGVGGQPEQQLDLLGLVQGPYRPAAASSACSTSLAAACSSAVTTGTGTSRRGSGWGSPRIPSSGWQAMRRWP